MNSFIVKFLRYVILRSEYVSFYWSMSWCYIYRAYAKLQYNHLTTRNFIGSLLMFVHMQECASLLYATTNHPDLPSAEVEETKYVINKIVHTPTHTLV